MLEFLFNKVAGLRPATLLKKRLWYRCPVKFAKFLRTLFLQNTSGQFLQTITSIALELPTAQFIKFKGALSGLTQLLTAESSLKMMKNYFNYFLFRLKSSFRSQHFCIDFLVM